MTKLPQSLWLLGLGSLCTSPAIAANTETTASEAASSAEVTEPPGASPDSGWHVSFSPYLWMSGLKGDMGVVEPVEPVAVDLSFGDVFNHLKFVAMGSFEARRGRFVTTTDTMYISLSATDNIKVREADFLDADLKTKTFVTTMTAGYRAVNQGHLYVDVFGGGRLNSVKTGLDLEGPQRSFSGSKSETWIDPVIGVRLAAPLGEHWSIKTYGDIGGFGVSSHFTWQVYGLIEYDLSRRWSLAGGWRHLSTDFDQKGFVFDARMDGPILGAIYRF
jgi:hypothetical protein